MSDDGAPAPPNLHALVREIVADVVKQGGFGKGTWRTHTTTAALAALLALGGSILAAVTWVTDLKADAARAKADVAGMSPRLAAVEVVAHDAASAAVASVDRDTRLRSVETSVSVLSSRLDQNNKALDELKGSIKDVQSDVKELLHRLPTK